MKTAILYTRVPKDWNKAQADDSLAKQEEELRKYCEENKIQVLKVIREIASGNDFNRREFTNLHLAIRKGELRPDYLLFSRIGIFSENVGDVLRMHHALQKFGVTTKAIQNVNIYFIRSIEY